MLPKVRMKLLAAIVERGQGERVLRELEHFHLHYHLGILCHGTATGEMLDYLGLTSRHKELILSLTPAPLLDEVCAAVRRKVSFKGAGQGILFTLPLSCISRQMAGAFSNPNFDTKERQVQDMEHTLILAVVNQGHSETVMEAAKPAGATGGTLLPGRRAGAEGMEQFFGIRLTREKDIVAILARRAQQQAIMRAILQKAGPATPAQGVVMSLPVEQVEGLAGEED